MINRFIYRLAYFMLLIPLMVITACDSEPPELMKATKQFESDEKRAQHIEYMRTHHMHALKHKRDETMYNGIRTEKHSLNACIDCHVPASHNGKVLRHTDQEHFCTTCHTYVAAKLNCFECHVDHPIATEITESESKKADAVENIVEESVVDNMAKSVSEVFAGKDLSNLSQQELIDLAFAYAKDKPRSREFAETMLEQSNVDSNSELKTRKSGGVSFNKPQQSEIKTKLDEAKSNE